MNKLSFKIDRFKFTADNNPSFVARIFIDDNNFLDTIINYERNLIVSDAVEGTISAFAPIYLYELYEELTEWCYNKDFEGRANIFGCKCGTTGCCPFTIRVHDEGESVVVWYDFNREYDEEWEYRNLGPYVFDKKQYDNALGDLKKWLDYDTATSEYCRQIIHDIAIKVIENLKEVPSGLAPEDLNLGGFAWLEIVYQVQYGESSFWDMYMDVLEVCCNNVYSSAVDIDKGLLEQYYSYIDDTMDENEIEDARQEAIEEIINEIKEEILHLATVEYLPGESL